MGVLFSLQNDPLPVLEGFRISMVVRVEVQETRWVVNWAAGVIEIGSLEA